MLGRPSLVLGDNGGRLFRSRERTMMCSAARRRLVGLAPLAFCTFLTLTRTTTARYGPAFCSSIPRYGNWNAESPRRTIITPLWLSQGVGGRGQRRGRYSREPVDESYSYGRENGRRRRSGGSRDYGDDDYEHYGGGGRRSRGRDGNNNYREQGRHRYSSDGRKQQQTPRRGGRGNLREEPTRERPPTPPLDSRPTYFTCRHTYETSLRQELLRSMEVADLDTRGVSFRKPHPGLVLTMTDDEATASFLANLRPMFALQALPDCVVVEAESIKVLAREIVDKLLSSSDGLLRTELVAAPRGSLAIHALVPEMGRGMPESRLPQYRRATKIGQELAEQLKKRCKAARTANPENKDTDDFDNAHSSREQWLLQVLLLEPSIVAASFARCDREPSHEITPPATPLLPNWTWPNMNLPAGLALVDVDETESQKRPSIIPSSAYRKLLEALWYLGERPPPNGEYPVVDLGACPGGWTGALRKMGCKVIAVDRSELAPILMQDEDVEYVQVDAFRFVPPWARTNEGESTSHWPGKTFDRPLADTWMVSDIIAYPDKIAELLDHWCGKRWVSHAIVTIKFQSEVPWEDVESAIAIVEGHGYACRTVHFFNNKHEVTLLAVRNDGQSKHGSNNLLGKPMYSPILPKPRKN